MAPQTSTRKTHTQTRRALLEDLRTHSPHESMAALATCVRRDTTRVSRDLKPLIDVGLVPTRPFGTTKRISAAGGPPCSRRMAGVARPFRGQDRHQV